MPQTLRSIADLPGPRGMPIFGNALQFELSQMHRKLEGWSEVHGPLFQLRMGRRRMMVVAGHERIAAILRDRPDGFSRSSRLRAVAQEMGMKPGVFMANGDDWRRQRRMVMSAFDPAHVKAWFPSLKAVTLRLRERWLRAAREGAGIDLQADLMRFTVDAVSGLAFGTQFDTLGGDDEIIQRHLDRIFPALFARTLAAVPLWRWHRSRADRALEASMGEVNRAIDGFVRDARARLDADPARRTRPANLLEAMICAADTDTDGIDDDAIAGNVMTMLLAGEDTTANTLAWMISLLHRNPAALARAIEEVDQHAPDPERFEPGTLSSLEWLEACAHETMRLEPVAPILPLEALRDTVIGDVAVPAGTVVINLLRRDCLDLSKLPEADRFLPGRWLAAGGEGTDRALSAGSIRRVSMPFGAGPRICPGRYLALLEIRLAMAMLLSTFEIEALGTPDGKAPREHLAFTMAPFGLKMKLRERA